MLSCGWSSHVRVGLPMQQHRKDVHIHGLDCHLQGLKEHRSKQSGVCEGMAKEEAWAGASTVRTNAGLLLNFENKDIAVKSRSNPFSPSLRRSGAPHSHLLQRSQPIASSALQNDSRQEDTSSSLSLSRSLLSKTKRKITAWGGTHLLAARIPDTSSSSQRPPQAASVST